jgi:hypothetical protein
MKGRTMAIHGRTTAISWSDHMVPLVEEQHSSAHVWSTLGECTYMHKRVEIPLCYVYWEVEMHHGPTSSVSYRSMISRVHTYVAACGNTIFASLEIYHAHTRCFQVVFKQWV